MNHDDPILMAQKDGVRTDALNKHLRELRSSGICCDIEKFAGTCPAILGRHKGEPFVVYAAFITHKHDASAWLMEIRTRWKGVDYPKKKPVDVILER